MSLPFDWEAHAEELRADIDVQGRQISRLSADRAELVEALRLLVDDVAAYEAWQRPCMALDNARTLLARVGEANNG